MEKHNEQMNVFTKLSVARAKLQAAAVKKSGANTESNYSYFELSDFVPKINEIFAEIGLLGHFRISESKGMITDERGRQNVIRDATLEIINCDNPEEVITFLAPCVSAGQQGNPIQSLGSMITYLRRYLWMMAMEICEADSVDCDHNTVTVNVVPEVPKAEPKTKRTSKKSEKAEPTTDTPVAEAEVKTEPAAETKAEPAAETKQETAPVTEAAAPTDGAAEQAINMTLDEALNHVMMAGGPVIKGRCVSDFLNAKTAEAQAKSSRIIERFANESVGADAAACKVVWNALKSKELTFPPIA